MRKGITFDERFRTYLWLLLGGVLFIFSNGRWVIPIASWAASIFIVHFYRGQKDARGIFLPLFVTVCAILISFKGVTHINGYLEYFVLIGLGIVFFIPYIVDRFLYSKEMGVQVTLILPLAGVTFEYLFSLVSPYGSWGSLAYTQYGNIAMIQLVSVTGLWGISFMMYWFYSLVNWLWDSGFDLKRLKIATMYFISVLCIIMLWGGMRLVVLKANSETVKVASISIPHKYLYQDQNFNRLLSNNPCPNEVIDDFKSKFNNIQDALLTLTEKEAVNGSKIIMWHELNGAVLKEDESTFISKVSRIAKEYQTYILSTLDVIKPGQSKSENKAILIDDKGETVYTYLKAIPTPDDAASSIKGDEIIPYANTPYGRIGNAICFDFDFPAFLRQAGEKGIDIMLDPSSDWEEIDPIHTRMAVFRAVENGFNFVRQTQLGLSLSTDYYGNIISSMDYFNTEDKIMISHVPIKGVKTFYSVFGDWFAWFCMMLLVYMIILRTGLINWIAKKENFIKK